MNARTKYAELTLIVIYLDGVILSADWFKDGAANSSLWRVIKKLQNETGCVPEVHPTATYGQELMGISCWRYTVGSRVVDYVWYRSMKIL
jgi:hypothetical protein